MNYTTAAQDAKEIRRRFKELGWNAKKVGVTCSNYSMGSSISVTIKSPEVVEETAESIAKDVAESISRCEITGEILNGGNRYVHVGHSRECQEILGRRHVDALKAALDEAKRVGDRSQIHPIAGTKDAGVQLQNASTAAFWIGGNAGMTFFPDYVDEAAFQLARALQRRCQFCGEEPRRCTGDYSHIDGIEAHNYTASA